RAMAPLLGAALAGLVGAYGFPTSTRGRRLIDRAGLGAFIVRLVVVFTVDDRTQALWHGGMLAVAVVSAVLIGAIAQPGRMNAVMGRSAALGVIGAGGTYPPYR